VDGLLRAFSRSITDVECIMTAPPITQMPCPYPMDVVQAEIVTSTIRSVLRMVLDAEATALCQATPCQRGRGRQALRTGSSQRHLTTRFGDLSITVPRLGIPGHHTALLPVRRRDVDYLCEPLLRLIAGYNTWSAIQQLLEPLRVRHGDATWLVQLAQRILAHANQTRQQTLPIQAASLHVSPIDQGQDLSRPELSTLQVTARNGGIRISWLAVTPRHDAPNWERLAQAMRERGLLAVDCIHGPCDPGFHSAMQRQWPTAALHSDSAPCPTSTRLGG
jgi:transposase-like protein